MIRNTRSWKIKKKKMKDKATEEKEGGRGVVARRKKRMKVWKEKYKERRKK